MPRPLEQAVAVITGASSGIGRAAALRMARRGTSLALFARAEEPLAAVAAECEGAGAEVLHRSVDVADEAAVEAFAAAVEQRFGRVVRSGQRPPQHRVPPGQVEGGWRTRWRGTLRRAFLGAAAGAARGLFQRNS